MSKAELEDPRYTGIFDLLGRTGAASVEVRYSEGEKPGDKTCWLAIAEYSGDRWDCAGATGPLGALIRLAEQLVDGGTCTWCQRPTSFLPELDPGDTLMMDAMTCAFRWTSKGYVRTCELASRQ